MKHRRQTKLTRQQILDCFRWTRTGFGDGMTMDEFFRKTRIPLSQIRKHFGSWAGLREHFDLPPRARTRRHYSDDDILRQFHATAERLGRFPTIQEFDVSTGVSTTTLYRRFGPLAKVEAQYRAWLRKQPQPAHTGHNVQIDANPPRDVVWVRNKWFNLRVGFELRSSDFKGREPDACDFLVVLEHDFPACPVRVIELQQVLIPGDPLPERLPID